MQVVPAVYVVLIEKEEVRKEWREGEGKERDTTGGGSGRCIRANATQILPKLLPRHPGFYNQNCSADWPVAGAL